MNNMFRSFNDERGREAFKSDPEAVMTSFGLNDEQKEAVRDRDVNRMLQAGASIYYLVKSGPIFGLNMQDFGGLQTGRSTEEFKAYLDSQQTGKPNG